jgi:two-component system, cell cycle response regulator
MEFASPVENAIPSSLPLKVLHIEDNLTDALIFRALINKAGSEINLIGVANTLGGGIDHSGRSKVDCIISDLNLPDSNGLEVVHRLTQKFPDIPLIVLTSSNELELGRQAIAAGAQDYLVKEKLQDESLSRVVKFAVERLRLRIHHDEVRRRMQLDLNHKEKVLQLSRRLHRVRTLDKFLDEFKSNFRQLFDGGLFSLFVFKPSSGWILGCHNHPYWKNDKGTNLQLKGVMAECVSKGRTIAFKQMTSSPFGAPNAHRYNLDNAITLPLMVDDQIVGVLNLNDNPAENFEDFALTNISNLAEHLSLALFNVLSYDEYQGLAHCDGLTGLYNRWYLHRQLPQEISRSRRYGLHLSAVICDIDFFKSVNDTYGHQVGDEVLMAFAKLLIKMVRDSDLAFRIGGEEFLLLLPNTSGKDAMTLAERIRFEWSEQLFLTATSQTLKSTASFGICELPDDCEMDAFIAFADRALYRAKQEGRNRCLSG